MLVVGGPGDARQSLLSLLLALDVRAIDGSALTDDRADRLADWADIVVLWRPAELHHTVTDDFQPGRLRSTVVASDDADVVGLLDKVTTRLPPSKP